MSYDNNPYYNPEKSGLEKVDEIDTGRSYEFDIFYVVREVATGKIYVATDSGCSCPIPFEGATFPDSFDLMETEKDLRARLDTWSNSYSYRKDLLEDKLSMLRKAFPNGAA